MQEVDDWEEPVTTTMSEQEEYANAGITKEQAEKTTEESTDDPVEDEDGNFVRKSKTKKTKKEKIA